MIHHCGFVFDGEQGKRYAAVVSRIVESVQVSLGEFEGNKGLGVA